MISEPEEGPFARAPGPPRTVAEMGPCGILLSAVFSDDTWRRKWFKATSDTLSS